MQFFSAQYKKALQNTGTSSVKHHKDSWGLEQMADNNCIIWTLKEGYREILLDLAIVYFYLME